MDGPESAFDFGPQTESGRSVREGVTEAAVVAKAEAGVDWFCEYCGAGNAGDVLRCRNCSAPRAEAPARLQRGASEMGAVADPQPVPEPVPQVTAPPVPRRSRGVPRRLVMLTLLGGFGTFLWWGLREHRNEGRVEQVRWTRTVDQERFVRETREGWRDQLSPRASVMPVNGRGEVAGVSNIRACHRAQRGTRKVADGTERVCRTKSRKVACGTEERCRRKDLGNGFAEEVCEDVTRYCSESYEDCRDETRYREVPVYAQQCSYDTYVWKQVDSRMVSGGVDTPRWPDVTAGPLDRLQRKEEYAVHIAWGDGQRHTLELDSEPDFRPWRPGTRVALTVNNFGQVTAAAVVQ